MMQTEYGNETGYRSGIGYGNDTECLNRKRNRKKFTWGSDNSNVLWVIFLLGILLGIILPNVVWRFQWRQKSLMAFRLLEKLGTDRSVDAEYLWELLRSRGGILLFVILCGFTVFGVVAALLQVFLMGAGVGAILGVSVLEFGLAGGVVGAGLLFPQYLVYLPVSLAVCGIVWEESARIWKNNGLSFFYWKKQRGRIFLYLALWLLGIWMEYCINPWIVEKIMSRIKFF